MTTVAFTRVSANKKTGPIPTSVTSEETCPDVCPLKTKGCYAASGPLALHWRKVSSGERGASWWQFCDEVRALPRGQIWRHNVAGDLPHTAGRIDGHKLDALVAANAGRRGFTYTHHNMAIPENQVLVEFANRHGFTVNLSANNPAHADALADLDVAPVVTILPIDAPRVSSTPAGRTIVGCPAEYVGTNCARCGLCQRRDRRGVIVGFRAHGTQKKTASIIARG